MTRQEQPRNPPGVQALKLHGWRLDACVPPDLYRMIPPGGTRTAPAETLTDEQCLERARAISAAKAQAAEAEARRLKTFWQPGQPDHDWPAEAGALLAEEATGPSPAPDLLTPPPGWSIWQDADETYGMMHDCGIKFRGTSPDRLITDASEASRWIAHLAGWHVSLDIAGNDWQASHETWGQVFAADLPRLALAAWRAAQAAPDLPNLPNDLIDAAFLAGWVFLSQGAGRQADHVYYDLPGGRRASFSPEEMRYELGLSASSSPDHVFRRPASVPPQMDILTRTILPGRFQPRQAFDDAGLSELAESINQYGILTRLKVFVNENSLFELIAGERRLRAAALAGLESVPCDVCEYTLSQIHEISIVDNLQRADLSPLEEGAAYERLIAELQISEAALSKRVGKSRGYIQQRRALAAADPTVQQALASGAISFTQARVLTQGAPAHAAQRKALKALASEQESGRRVTEAQAQEIAARASLDSAKKDLQALGWSYDTRYTGGECIVWAAGERPCVWTGAEIAETVQAQRRPQTAHSCEVGALTEEEITVLRQVGDWSTNHEVFAPWIFVRNTSKRVWMTLDEARALVGAARLERETMEACYAVAGWTLTNDRTWLVWTIRSPQGRTDTLIGWASVQAHYATVQNGTAKTEPVEVKTQACAACGELTGLHALRRDLCPTCWDRAREQECTQRETLARERGERWGPWLAGGPRDLLACLVQAIAEKNTTAFCGEWMDTGRLTAWVENRTTDELAAHLVRYAAYQMLIEEGATK